MKKFILLSIAYLVGCTPIIKERDIEKEEMEYIKAHGKPVDEQVKLTSPHIFAKKEDGIRITVHRMQNSIKDGLDIQNWYAVVTNENKVGKCFATKWHLMDFEVMEEPHNLTYIGPNESIPRYVHLRQNTWNLGGVRFALEPSGYVDGLYVIDPPKGQSEVTGSECVIEPNVVDEKDAEHI